MKKILVAVVVIFIFLTYEFALSQTGNWQRVYGPWSLNSDCFGEDICESNNNTYFLIGNNNSPGGMYLRKLNNLGQVLDTTFLLNYSGFTGVSTSDGGCVIMGLKLNSDDDIYAVKINSNCNVDWLKVYPNTPSASTYRIIKTSDNKFIACGRISYLSAFVIKLDSLGNKIWIRTYNAPFSRNLYDVTESSSGDYILTGLYVSSETESFGRITKIDTSGNIIWDKNLLNDGYGIGVNSINNLGSKYLIGSDIYDTSSKKFLPGFIKINENGDILETHKYPAIPNYYQFVRDSKVINENKYLFLISYEKWTLPDTTKARLVTTDSSGYILNDVFYSSNSDYTNCFKIFFKNSSNVFVIGRSNHINSYYENMYLIKTDTTLIAPVVGIFNQSIDIPIDINIIKVYPNPFNTVANIVIKIKTSEIYKVSIFDILGKEVAVVYNGLLLKGDNKLYFNMGKFSSGIYFINANSINTNLFKKVVLLK